MSASCILLLQSPKLDSLDSGSWWPNCWASSFIDQSSVSRADARVFPAAVRLMFSSWHLWDEGDPLTKYGPAVFRCYQPVSNNQMSPLTISQPVALCRYSNVCQKLWKWKIKAEWFMLSCHLTLVISIAPLSSTCERRGQFSMVGTATFFTITSGLTWFWTSMWILWPILAHNFITDKTKQN